MKSATHKKRGELLRAYTTGEIRRIFRNRLDDEMLASVAVMEMPIAGQRKTKPHILAWIGYEILIGTYELNQN